VGVARRRGGSLKESRSSATSGSSSDERWDVAAAASRGKEMVTAYQAA
jgi:hypothetical protein